MSAITRPDGRAYRPRKVAAHAVTDERGDLSGVLVLGTHDIARAAVLAGQFAAWQLGPGWIPALPLAGWWRDGLKGGERGWVADEARGRAGVWFQAVAEVPAPPCDAEHPSVYAGPDGTTVCRCIVCARCGHHTGNSHQGHYWKACKVLAARLRDELAPGEQLSAGEWLRRTCRDDWHMCCDDPVFGCELEPAPFSTNCVK